MTAPFEESRMPEVSVVCPVTRQAGDISLVHREYSSILHAAGEKVEFLYVIDSSTTEVEHELSRLAQGSPDVQVFRMAKGFGEAAAPCAKKGRR